MHNNFYFLRRLTTELEPILTGSALVECFSQNKEELVIRFLTPQNSEFIIRADLNPNFCCLSFPAEFQRAKKNSVDLFQALDGARVKGIRQFSNERSFVIQFDRKDGLLFKMHGNRANIVRTDNGAGQELFRNHLKADLRIHVGNLDRSLNFDAETFHKRIDALEKYFVTMGPLPWMWLESHGWTNLTNDEKWSLFNELLTYLNHGEFLIVEMSGRTVLSLVPIGTTIFKTTSAIVAINEFYRRHTISSALTSERESILKKLNKDISHARNYIAKNKEKLERLRSDNHFQKWADLLMANLHRIEEGSTSVDVEDLYNLPAVIHIPLIPHLKPQENAERYYRKGRNQKLEIQKLVESIESRAVAMGHLLELKSNIDKAKNIKALREISKSVVISIEPGKKLVSLPYHEFEYMNFKIWVGKSAENNDKLTLKHAHKEDLWLHVKDVSGSHVVVKQQSGKPFPKEVIHRAAELAAFNSKRKNETLCPVVYTHKKYVRKRKGDPPGAVVVEREKVIMVEPRK